MNQGKKPLPLEAGAGKQEDNVGGLEVVKNVKLLMLWQMTLSIAVLGFGLGAGAVIVVSRRIGVPPDFVALICCSAGILCGWLFLYFARQLKPIGDAQDAEELAALRRQSATTARGGGMS